MKSLIYIGNSYHNKTKSSLFLEELFMEAYEVEIASVDLYSDNPGISLDYLRGRKFDVLVLFQVALNIEELRKLIQFKYPVFFPMFDGLEGVPEQFWDAFREFNIINFSKSLHERLIHLGLSSYYIQYFPKPFESFEYGDSANVYFWQRVTDLNIKLVEKLLSKTPINKIHIHKVMDPNHKFQEPSSSIIDKIEYSTWYETRKEMLKDIEACSIYIAPRLYEGIGMSFLEAMAMGRCVIAPDHPTMNEYIIHNKTGLLFDFHLPKAIKIKDIRTIQENAITYIKKGYSEWEREKYKILEWVETPLQYHKRSRRSNQYINSRTYSIFAYIPLIVTRSKPNKRYYDLLGLIRVMKSKKKKNGVVFYLFGLIPVWIIKHNL